MPNWCGASTHWCGDLPYANLVSGNLYIADSGNDRIKKHLAEDLSFISKIGTTGSGNDQFNLPGFITCDDTYLYISDFSNNRIVRRLKTDVLTYDAQVAATAPRGITNTEDNIYAINGTTNQIGRRPKPGMALASSYGPTFGSTTLASAWDLTADKDYLYITDSVLDLILKISLVGGSYVDKIGSTGTGNDQFDSPRGITSDETYLYIIDRNNERIVKRFKSNLSYAGEVALGAGTLANGLTIDSTYLYFVNNTSLHKYNKNTLLYDSEVGTSGSGDSQFDEPLGITSDSWWIINQYIR